MEQTKKSNCCGSDVRFEQIDRQDDQPVCLACDKFCQLQKNSDLTLHEVYAVRDDVLAMETMCGHFFDLDYSFNARQAFEKRYRITDRKSWHKHDKKQIKIGDILNAKQAIQYMKLGGFINRDDSIYKVGNNRLLYFAGKYWLDSTVGFEGLDSEYKLTACENPEVENQCKVTSQAELDEIDQLKSDLAKKDAEIEKLQDLVTDWTERCLAKTIEIKKQGEEIASLKEQLAYSLDDIAELKRKSDWLPFPENKPRYSGNSCMVQTIDGNAKAYAFYNLKNCFYLDGFDITSQVKFFKEI